LVTSVWETHKFGAGYNYPGIFTEEIVPVYTLIIIISIALFSDYRIPLKVSGAIKGVGAGTAVILITYALLPLELRFSRAIIIFSGLISLIAVPGLRVLFSMIFPGIILNPFVKGRSTVIVSDQEGYLRVKELISASGSKNTIAGRVSTMEDDLGEDVLGNINQIKEVIRINRISEIIFTTRDLTASQIIESMHTISRSNVVIRISPAGEKLIIGSKYTFPKSIY
jgi:FlaA1/EpsC-like NDP-sugar epimerase